MLLPQRGPATGLLSGYASRVGVRCQPTPWRRALKAPLVNYLFVPPINASAAPPARTQGLQEDGSAPQASRILLRAMGGASRAEEGLE